MSNVIARRGERPRIMFIVPAELDALVAKGVSHMIRERDEGGFFERVVTVHPVADRDRVVPLDEVHVVYEFDRGHPPGRGGWRLLRPLFTVARLCRLVRRIRRVARDERVDIIRATDPATAGLLGWAVWRLTPGTRFCVSVHADYEKRHTLDSRSGAPTVLGSRRVAVAAEHFVLRRAELVLPIRQSLAAKTVAAGARPGSVRVIPHGIDLAPLLAPPRTDVWERFGLDRSRRIISFVGRLSRENYVDDVVEVARRLVPRGDVTFVLVGSGPEERRLVDDVARLALGDAMRLVGFQPHDVALDVRRASAVSLCLMAGFSLIEACAAGSPVVAYDVEWHHELVRTGETGMLVGEGDLGALTHAVASLLDDPGTAHRLGAAARRLAMARHDLTTTSAIKRAAYESMLVTSRPRSGAR